MANREPIPFVDLVTPHRDLEEELVAVFRTALRSAGFIGGSMVSEFEREFAEFCDVTECVGVGSGTDALRFALIAAGVGGGDIVITVPNTFIATAEAITQAGGRPAFVDIDERTYNLDPEKLREYIETECALDSTGKLTNRKTGVRVSAIIPVHLYGQMADMDPILELAERYDLLVIEDACQAHGAQYFSKREQRWRTAGSMGKAAAFSFYPGKNLGACGEAGAVTTNDLEIAKQIRVLRDHGQVQKYYHDREGYNGRLDAIQAGMLRIKLRHLAEWNRERCKAADRYNKLFQPMVNQIILPYEPSWSRAVYHLYVVRTSDREGLREHLNKENIGTGIHYPIPLHLQNALQTLGYKQGDFPVTEKISSEILSLPMYPHIHSDQQEFIAATMTEFNPARISLAVR
jgi:dTDP-4-amino-4,6-dideoxygalactose transaminase